MTLRDWIIIGFGCFIIGWIIGTPKAHKDRAGVKDGT